MSQVNYAQTDSIDKYGNPKDWKKQKLDQVREYHGTLIRELGISPLDFNMKMPFYDRHGRYVVGIFGSEFKKDKGFFFELVTRDLEPLETDRKVYRITRNDNFEEEYEMNEKGSFLVPVDELRIVNPASVAISKGAAVFSNDKIFGKQPVQQPVQQKPVQQTAPAPQPTTQFIPVNNAQLEAKIDAPYSEMTIRDYMAIHTGKPVSLKPWLNDLLQKLPF
jgi:hypothetical protein